MDNKANAGFIAMLNSGAKRTTLTSGDLKIVVKYPSFQDRIQIGVARAKMMDGASTDSIDAFTDSILVMTSTLSVLTVEAPVGFNIFALEDFDVLNSLYEQYISWMNSFHEGTQGSANDDNSKHGEGKATVDNNENI
jgi:hypothetical protein